MLCVFLYILLVYMPSVFSFVFARFWTMENCGKTKRDRLAKFGDSVETEVKKAFQRRVQLQYLYFLTFEFQKVEL